VEQIKIVISDLHLGAGRVHEGNRLEDFDQDAAWAELLDGLAAESQRRRAPVELILAGDILEFLQVPALPPDEPFDPQRAYPGELYAPSDSASSLHKLELIMQGHPRFFEALAAFLSLAPRRQVCLIKGNHDVNLHWQSVQDALRAALGAEGERSDCLAFAERYISREGIYVEHGNQYLEWVNRWPDFEQPHDAKNPEELYMPAGSRFVYLFFNEVERQHAWIDGVKPITALIWYLLALDFPFAVRALRLLLRLAPTLILDSLPLAWALARLLEARQQVVDRLDDREQMAALERNIKERAAFYNESDAGLELYGVPREGQPLSHFRAYGHNVLPRGQEEQQAQRDLLARVAAQKAAQEGARVVVMGHVHEAREADLPGGAIYINTGTWTWSMDMAGADYATWQELFRRPERFVGARRLTYARIEYDAEGAPSARLLEFTPKPPRRPSLLRSLVRWMLGKPNRQE
jgi:UDP-2,3-diacylglucosamine pyrophosphatase LpxH